MLDEAAAAAQARELAAQPRPATERLVVLDLRETILVYKFPSLSRKEIVKMVRLPETDLKNTRSYQEVFDEGREAAEVALLLRQLKRRLGTLSAEHSARLGGLSSEQRGASAEAVLDFSAQSDLDAWLCNG